MNVPVIRNPVAGNGVHRCRYSAGQSKVDIIFWFQKFIRLAVDVGNFLLDKRNMAGRVLSRQWWGPAGQSNPARQLKRVVTGHLERATHTFPDIRSPPGIHPDDGIHQVVPVSVHRDRTHPLGGTIDGYKTVHRYQISCQQTFCRTNDGLPPVVRILLGSPSFHQMQGHGFKFKTNDFTVNGDNRRLGAGRSQINRQNTWMVMTHLFIPHATTLDDS